MRPVALSVAALVVLLAGASQRTGTSIAAPAASPRIVLDLGDSLSVGTAPYLRSALPGYRLRAYRDVGLHADDAASRLEAGRAVLPRLVVVSVGTNDDPRIVSTFARAVSRVLGAAGPRRCVVWPTIVRPAAAGATYERLNGALARASARHRNLVLVDWVGMVDRHPRWLSNDGVHVSAAGYRARARAIAAALRSRCERVAG